MQRHCKDWASRFSEEAVRATVWAQLHEAKALGNTVTPPSDDPHKSGFAFHAMNAQPMSIRPTPAQISLYRQSIMASSEFSDQARMLSWMVSAKAQSLVDIRALRQSAAALFESEQELVQSLTAEQRETAKSELHVMAVA